MNKKSRIAEVIQAVENELGDDKKTPSVSPFNRLARLVHSEVILTPEEQKELVKIMGRTREKIGSMHFIQEWIREMEKGMEASDMPYVLTALERCRTEKDIIHFCARYIASLSQISSLKKEHEKKMFMVDTETVKNEQLHWHNYLESLVVQNILHALELHPVSPNLRSLWIKVLEDHYSKTIGRLKKGFPADLKIQALQVRPRKHVPFKKHRPESLQ